MEAKEIIARRVAQEVKPDMLVNLGIGLPSLVAHYLPKDVHVFFQAENGVIGLGPRPPEGMEDPDLTDAGGGFVTAMPGAASIDSAMSFGIIRGGHLDMTVLGGLEVDERGYLANWMVPGKMVPGMGGAMDLVSGAKKVVVAMVHTAKGAHKIVSRCSLPLTATRRVSLIVTEMAVIEPTASRPCAARDRAGRVAPGDPGRDRRCPPHRGRPAADAAALKELGGRRRGAANDPRKQRLPVGRTRPLARLESDGLAPGRHCTGGRESTRWCPSRPALRPATATVRFVTELLLSCYLFIALLRQARARLLRSGSAAAPIRSMVN